MTATYMCKLAAWHAWALYKVNDKDDIVFQFLQGPPPLAAP